jgi:membrane-bound serine protease (ClpP class)
MELFLLPGFGLFGVAGAAMLLASLVMASQTFGNIETGRDFTEARQTLTTISYTIVTVIVIATALSRFLPKIPFLSGMILTPPGSRAGDDSGPRLAPESAVGDRSLIGATGTAETVLRPAGKATINGRLLNVVSEGSFIPAGRRVEVVQTTGKNVVVREV